MIKITYGVPLNARYCRCCGREPHSHNGLCPDCLKRFDDWRYFKVSSPKLDRIRKVKNLILNSLSDREDYQSEDKPKYRKLDYLRAYENNLIEKLNRDPIQEDFQLVEWLTSVLRRQPKWLIHRANE